MHCLPTQKTAWRKGDISCQIQSWTRNCHIKHYSFIWPDCLTKDEIFLEYLGGLKWRMTDFSPCCGCCFWIVTFYVPLNLHLYDRIIWFLNLYIHIGYVQIPVAARSEAWVCGCSLAGISASNPARDVEVFLVWLLCVVRWSSRLRADHLSREALPSMVCSMSVFANPRKGRPWPEIGQKRHRKKVLIIYSFFDILAAVDMFWLTWYVGMYSGVKWCYDLIKYAESRWTFIT
jgi:hypothetical protein